LKQKQNKSEKSLKKSWLNTIKEYTVGVLKIILLNFNLLPMIITKQEILEMIEEDIQKEKDFIQECMIMKVENTSATEWKISNLMFMQNYIDRIESLTDIEEDKEKSLD